MFYSLGRSITLTINLNNNRFNYKHGHVSYCKHISWWLTLTVMFCSYKQMLSTGVRCRKSLKVLIVEVKVIFSVFLAIYTLKLCLKSFASERAERKMRKISVLGINNHKSAAVRGARAGCAPWIR